MVCESYEDGTVKRDCAATTGGSLGFAYCEDLFEEIDLTPG
jgi:hypothetical protein